jgi:hypothetical protein
MKYIRCKTAKLSPSVVGFKESKPHRANVFGSFFKKNNRHNDFVTSKSFNKNRG